MNLEDQIQNLLNEIERQESLREHIMTLDQKTNVLKTNKQKLETRIKSILRSIDNKESKRVKFLANIFGSNQDGLEKLKHDYLLKDKELQLLNDKIKLCQFELETLLQKKLDKSELDNELDKLLTKKEKKILETSSKKSAELIQLNTKISALELREYNHTKCIKLAENLRSDLILLRNEILKLTNSSSNQLYGSGSSASYAKKKYIDKSKGNIVKFGHDFDQFLMAYEKLVEKCRLTLDLTSFEDFISSFASHEIYDKSTSHRIKKSIVEANNNIAEIDHALDVLNMQKQKLNESKFELLEIKKDFVLHK